MEKNICSEEPMLSPAGLCFLTLPATTKKQVPVYNQQLRITHKNALEKTAKT